MAGRPKATTKKPDRQSDRVQQNKKALIAAMQKSLGIVSAACRTVGVDRSTFYHYVNNDPEFAEAVKDVEDIALDFIEGKAYKQVEDGNTAMIIFMLKTKGKRRGYIEKQEHEHSGSLAIEQITGMEIK